jgi:hypothetical protein
VSTIGADDGTGDVGCTLAGKEGNNVPGDGREDLGDVSSQSTTYGERLVGQSEIEPVFPCFAAKVQRERRK